ncbi:MAG: response regulator [Candidatus Margulisbacteria bacterium]|nr:response regulator [Candidatus Margulisiibacteriota bacterium]
MRIMIVDDELVCRKKLCKILENEGKVEEFIEGQSALDAFEKALDENNPFRLVTMDMHMPGLLGLEVLNRMRQIEANRNIDRKNAAIIVMVTTDEERENILNAISYNVNDYIAKPFNKEFILSRLKEWLSE